jgi:hypothetical protein
MMQAEEDWQLERLLWVAFFKEDSQSCLLANLPKDIIYTIISYLGRKRPKNSWSNVFCVAGFELYGKLFLPTNNMDAMNEDVPMPNASNKERH